VNRLASVAVLLVVLGVLEARAEPTGSALPGLEAYDELMTALLKKWDVPGAGLAVAHKDRLLLVRERLQRRCRSRPVGRQGQGEAMAGRRSVRAHPVMEVRAAGRRRAGAPPTEARI